MNPIRCPGRADRGSCRVVGPDQLADARLTGAEAAVRDPAQGERRQEARLLRCRQAFGVHGHGQQPLPGGPLDREHHLLAERLVGGGARVAHPGELLGKPPQLPPARQRGVVVDVDERAEGVRLALEAHPDQHDRLVVDAQRGERVVDHPGQAHRQPNSVPSAARSRSEDGPLTRAAGTRVVPPYQRQGTGSIRGTDDRPGPPGGQ